MRLWVGELTCLQPAEVCLACLQRLVDLVAPEGKRGERSFLAAQLLVPRVPKALQ